MELLEHTYQCGHTCFVVEGTDIPSCMMCNTNTHHCKQCGREMNPVDYMLGPVCLKCCKENHATVVGKKGSVK